MESLRQKFIDDGFLQEGYHVTMDKCQEDPSFEEEWNSFLNSWIIGIKKSETTATVALRILSYSIAQIQSDTSKKNIWILTLTSLIPVGFRQTIGTELYCDWLKEVKSLPNLKPKLEGYDHECYSPRLLSMIATLCMLYYLERFAMMHVRNMAEEQEIALMENEIVRSCCKADPTIVLFPLAYIAHHVMDLFLPPSNDVRNIEMNFQVQLD
jgi:hypothetical protein